MTALDQFVDFAQRIADGPYRYDTGPGRCDPLNSGYADCSGLVVASVHAAGAVLGCTGSFVLARQCHAMGAGIALGAARATRGACVWIGINEGQGGIPGVDPGHIAISLGDGRTVEARNHRVGILNGAFDGRGWTYAAMPCWLLTAPPPPPPPLPFKEVEMYVLLSPNRPARLIGVDGNPKIGPGVLALHRVFGVKVTDGLTDAQYDAVWAAVGSPAP